MRGGTGGRGGGEGVVVGGVGLERGGGEEAQAEAMEVRVARDNGVHAGGARRRPGKVRHRFSPGNFVAVVRFSPTPIGPLPRME